MSKSNIKNPTEKMPQLKLEVINPPELYDPTPNGYNHTITVQNGDGMLFIAGQGGEDINGILPETFENQVQQAFKNLNIALDAAGTKPNSVVKITTYVVNHTQSKLPVITENVKKLFGSHFPTQTLVPVPRLALDGMLFEVDAIAVLHNG